MTFQEFYHDFQASLKKYDIILSEQTQQMVGLYFHLLMQAQERMNLTSYRTIDDFVQYHLLDTLNLAKYIQIEPEMRLLDIGSGGGIPGMILSALFKWKSVGMVESIQKKAQFLNETAQQLGFETVEIHAERAEELAHLPKNREQYDIVTARALAPLPQALELTAPFARHNGLILLPRGANEVVTISEEISVVLGIIHENTHEYSLPGREDTFKLVILKKTAPTQEKYPRKPGKIRKHPL